MYQPPAVRRARNVTRQVAPPQTGADRFALAFALFSAFTFMGTLMMMCAVVGIAALLLRSETRWGQLANLLSSQGVNSGVSPLPTPTVEVPTPAPTGVVDVPNQPPTGQPLPNQPAPAVSDGQPQATPAPQQPPQQQSPLATPPALQQPVTPEGSPQLTTDAEQTPPSDPGVANNLVGILVQYSNNLIDALEQLSDLANNPLFGDSNWMNLTQGQISRVRQTYNELAGIPTPPELSATHSTLLNAAAQCNSATYTVENALNSGDQSLLQTGADQVNACLELAYEASSEVNNLLSGQ